NMLVTPATTPSPAVTHSRRPMRFVMDAPLAQYLNVTPICRILGRIIAEGTRYVGPSRVLSEVTKLALKMLKKSNRPSIDRPPLRRTRFANRRFHRLDGGR